MKGYGLMSHYSHSIMRSYTELCGTESTAHYPRDTTKILVLKPMSTSTSKGMTERESSQCVHLLAGNNYEPDRLPLDVSCSLIHIIYYSQPKSDNDQSRRDKWGNYSADEWGKMFTHQLKGDDESLRAHITASFKHDFVWLTNRCSPWLLLLRTDAQLIGVQSTAVFRRYRRQLKQARSDFNCFRNLARDLHVKRMIGKRVQISCIKAASSWNYGRCQNKCVIFMEALNFQFYLRHNSRDFPSRYCKSMTLEPMRLTNRCRVKSRVNQILAFARKECITTE